MSFDTLYFIILIIAWISVFSLRIYCTKRYWRSPAKEGPLVRKYE